MALGPSALDVPTYHLKNPGVIEIWEIGTKELKTKINYGAGVTALDWSPDGRYVVSGSLDGSFKVWDIEMNHQVMEERHEDVVTTTAFSSIGNVFATGSLDSFVRVWELNIGQKNREISRLKHENGVGTIAFSPDGKKLAIASNNIQNTSITLWSWWVKDLLREVCSRLDRNLTQDEWNRFVIGEPYQEICAESVSQSDILDYELLDNQEETVDWFSLRRLLPQRQSTQAPPSDLVRESAATQAFEALGSGMDLSGLGLSSSEQLIFFRLQTQVSAWDMDGSRSSLSLLQDSDNVCISAFANQLTDALDQQNGEGFRQITPIKRELNAQQGCRLPLYPYPFSP